jgi:uncharacterized protein (DUF1778 family)
MRAADHSPESESSSREARLEVRLTREQKALVSRAAAARGTTVAGFARQAVLAAAAQVVTEHGVVQLCVADQEALAVALLSPREPNDRLKVAYRDYLTQMNE